MSCHKDLDAFRNEWKSELKLSKRPKRSSKSEDEDLIVSEECSSETVQKDASDQSARVPVDSVDPVDQVVDVLGRGVDVRKRKNTISSFILAENLLKGDSHGTDVGSSSACDETAKESYLMRNKKLKLSSPEKHTREDEGNNSFVDIFIADLNDLCEIPFFDVQLPKEVALKIFRFLDASDLCRCCQVSRAWRALAEDEYLWNLICHRLEYKKLVRTAEQQNWKEIVKDHVLKEKQYQMNWKMRTGKHQELKHTWGNVLTSTHSVDNCVVAGYTSGEVKFWDLDSEAECTFSPSSTALVVNEDYDQGTIANFVTSVAMTTHHTAAFYNQGCIDIWENQGRSQPIQSFSCFPGTVAHENQQIISAKDTQHFAVSYGSTVQTFKQIIDNSEKSFVTSDQLVVDGELVKHIKFLPSLHNTQPLIAIATSDRVCLHKSGHDPSHMTEVHHVVHQYVTCMDASATCVGVGVQSFGDFKVRLYDIESGKETGQCLGHSGSIQCVNLAESPPQSCVTGCDDNRVRVYDTRLADPVITLRGHSSCVRCVQMDDWKVVTGSGDGMLCVWDQRMSSKLWDAHNRHPVRYLKFSNRTLITANIPSTLLPLSHDEDNITQRRYRGTLSVYEFGAESENEQIPEICLSSYDRPDAYNYNIRLTVPYDEV